MMREIIHECCLQFKEVINLIVEKCYCQSYFFNSAAEKPVGAGRVGAIACTNITKCAVKPLDLSMGI